ncbi:MAG: adenine deaminase [Gemmatimonadetes bacterium]|nr:adenine deaminase [Gemmatimonadota bacterium]NNM04006.1 adenine deaminase [Gemmatimonadota bacterium]
MENPSLLQVARGDAPADVLFRGGRVANVFSGEILEEDVAVRGPFVAGLGPGYEALEVVDLGGRFLLPGFIDAHVHIESSLATPLEFARAVIPRGTTTVVADPHEIANVHGLEGIQFMLDASEGLPLTVFVMASSCVPATPMGTAGANLRAEDLEPLLHQPRVLGLAEVMNFPGVIFEDRGVAEKLEVFSGRPVDGHAPGLQGPALNAYAAAGPDSDHECISVGEALERIRRGMTVFFRQATNAKNLEALLPVLTPLNQRRVALCTDDRQPPDLLDEGGIDAMIRTLIKRGIPPVEAIRMATLNPAEHFRLRDRGGIAPGRRADLLVVDDLETLTISEVYAGGIAVARGGRALPWDIPAPPPPPAPSMRVAWESVDLRIPAESGKVRVIQMIPDQLVTDMLEMDPPRAEGFVVSDPSRDLLKIAVLERHHASGRVGLGLVSGMGLKKGAIAGTVAHDHHNLIALGVDDDSILAAARGVGELGGGLAVAAHGELVDVLPLPVGGLMSTEPIGSIRDELERILRAARNLGTPLHDPFMAMSFLALEVIPSLKITDQGLVDVEAFTRVGLWV